MTRHKRFGLVKINIIYLIYRRKLYPLRAGLLDQTLQKCAFVLCRTVFGTKTNMVQVCTIFGRIWYNCLIVPYTYLQFWGKMPDRIWYKLVPYSDEKCTTFVPNMIHTHHRNHHHHHHRYLIVIIIIVISSSSSSSSHQLSTPQ